MKNELNLFLMSPDEVTRWYKPQSPEEQYLVDLISSVDFTKQREIEDLNNDIDELEDEIESPWRENNNLKDLVKTLNDDILNLQ